VSLLEPRIGRNHLLGRQYDDRALTKKLLPAHAPPLSHRVELGDEVVIELYQNLASSHNHMTLPRKICVMRDDV
jgi:hypothetical protein